MLALDGRDKYGGMPKFGDAPLRSEVMMFKYEDYRGYTYAGNGVWGSDLLGYVTVSAVSATIDANRPQEDKPCYLAVMAHRSQMQAILDNAHLFDPAFVNAVSALVQKYDDLEIVFD